MSQGATTAKRHQAQNLYEKYEVLQNEAYELQNAYETVYYDLNDILRDDYYEENSDNWYYGSYYEGIEYGEVIEVSSDDKRYEEKNKHNEALTSFFLFDRFGIFALISDSLIQFQSEHEKLFFVLYGIIFIILAGLIVLKKAIIGAIRLYQHYAPEDIRRRCLFKPTCSEYAILAVKKYGVVIGLFKAYKRLFKRCRGNIYMIDYP
ncbi:MAG: membrane protein insertion efficiency factor YidD [Clostridia bacterium]|nr:membrane protein insertion efficiency factor YidD [Clostridia bacterium]